jgi:hypothetical protein
MTAPLTPEQRALRSRVGAYASWANTADPAARTAPARKASMERFERQVDPHNELPDAERARRADAARKAYFTRLALRSARSRAKAVAARHQAVELDAEAEAADAELGSARPQW